MYEQKNCKDCEYFESEVDLDSEYGEVYTAYCILREQEVNYFDGGEICNKFKEIKY